MPYILVVDGVSAHVKPSNDLYHAQVQIVTDDSYVDLNKRVKDSGLKISLTRCEDDDELAVFLGKELYPDRHIFQGLTVSLTEKVSAEERILIDDFGLQMISILEKLGYSPEITKGLVISQFD